MSIRQSWFDTIFDEPVDGLAVSSVVSSGQDPALRMVDGFVRGIAVVGRFATTPALLAFKVASHGQPVRVRVWVRFDWTSVKWWAQRVVGGSVPGGRRARLLLVRSQGRLRHALVLSRQRHGTTEPVDRACITFDLAADEVPDDGLVIVELLAPDVELPTPAATGLAHQPAVGLQVDHVEIAVPDGEPAPGTPIGWGACPHLGVATWGDLLLDDTGRDRAGVLVLNPDRIPGVTDGATATVSLTVRRTPKPSLRTLPKRALRKARHEVGRRLPEEVRAALRPVLHRQPAQPTPPSAPAAAPAERPRALTLRTTPSPASAVPTLPPPTSEPPSPPTAVPASALAASAVSLASGRSLSVDIRPGADDTIDLVIADRLDGPALLCVELTRAKPRHGFGFQVVRVAASPAPVPAGH